VTLRARLGVALAVAMVAAVGAAFKLGPDAPSGALLLNLSTEIAGIIVTVLVVDELFARRRREEQVRRVAWDLLHEVAHALWVWQGGRREATSTELMQLVAAIGPTDPLPWFTQDLFMRVGTRSAALRDLRPDLVRASHELAKALDSLASLAGMRDVRPCLTSAQTAECVDGGIRRLLKILRQAEPASADQQSKHGLDRDPTVEGQEWRHFGDRLEGCSAKSA
jgi:hypothetical protein